MGRSCRCVVLLLAVLSFFAFSATALADDPEPLTVSASSTRETCTIGSVTTLDYNIVGGVPPYQVTVDGREIEQHSDPNYIPCRTSEFWWPLEELGGDGTQRISVRVSDSAGSRAYALAKVRHVPPLPAPRYVEVTSGVDGRSAAHLTVDWNVPYLPPEQRTGEAVIRRRVKGSNAWTVELHQGEQTYGFTYQTSFRVDSPPGGEQQEVQVAQIRHPHDLQAPDALRWSPTALVTTAAHPHELQAEATHDAITLSWGPHAPNLTYVAELSAVEADPYRSRKRVRVTTGPLYQARFADLQPNTLYGVAVYRDDGRDWPTVLDQHRFEIRTEPAPEGWSTPSWIPTNITAAATDGELEVTWTPPSTGARHETTVCAYPNNNPFGQRCETVYPGQSSARLRLATLGFGGTFRVRVETQTIPAGKSQIDIHVPTYDTNFPTRGEPASAPRLTDFYWIPTPWKDFVDPHVGDWTFEWDPDGAEISEVSWQHRGQYVTREARIGHVSMELAEGHVPEAVRVRLLREGVWTPWSAPAEVPQFTRPIGRLRFAERGDVLQFRWEHPEIDVEVEGYRIYVRRNQGPEEVFDVGRQTTAEISIRPNDEEYWVSVAPLIEGYGELGRRQPDSYKLLPLTFKMNARFSPCPAEQRAPLLVQWSIIGGARPFIVSMGDALGFKTEERSGYFVVECQTEADGTMSDISGWVIDSTGQTTVEYVETYDSWYGGGHQDESYREISFGPRSVHRDHILLSWSCRYWPFTAVLRWREDSQIDWRYVLELEQQRHDDYLCRGAWQGLKPLGTYEYQLARYERSEQLRRPERLQWSQAETVTTPGDAQGLSIERDGETITVQWLRQPEAWAYLVGLRAEGRTWWKRYDPSGEANETVFFYRVPTDLSLSVELISPPLEDGEEVRSQGYDPNIASGH
ncbi:MAG: hypothetical protein OXD50_13050 [Chloroflexi bacterium]|nr:hypothetical protein [Chloroflexota bacterium]